MIFASVAFISWSAYVSKWARLQNHSLDNHSIYTWLAVSWRVIYSVHGRWAHRVVLRNSWTDSQVLTEGLLVTFPADRQTKGACVHWADASHVDSNYCHVLIMGLGIGGHMRQSRRNVIVPERKRKNVVLWAGCVWFNLQTILTAVQFTHCH
jgi:hypothetical protein